MITLFVIGMIVFVFKMVSLALRLAWGVTKWALLIFAVPAALIGLLVAGIRYLALPLLGIGLIAAFFTPAYYANRVK